ncbi:MAG: Glyoxalase/bleomycin resistance protein/dioxygenase [Hydrocarboniphaga sp.]|uniref:VOC family protein n=1 Tax=Hydrocarboniphaga sp. TaxID=2033016 RepID=UPI00261A7E52|nr:VOC family protein [Hydrocarboniphaga sp.]MDB5972331.1 Glyoxalase/bleomycin resistance protein/dioxygenase [Hydrocarboniphaga sp.]
MKDIGFTHIALPVRSLDATIDFYGRYAAMQVVHRRPGVAWLSDKTRPFVIVFFEIADEIRPFAQHAHLGVGVASREALDELCRKAEVEGCLESGPADAGWPVGYWSILKDPDGHRLELAYGQGVGFTVESRNE